MFEYDHHSLSYNAYSWPIAQIFWSNLWLFSFVCPHVTQKLSQITSIMQTRQEATPVWNLINKQTCK